MTGNSGLIQSVLKFKKAGNGSGSWINLVYIDYNYFL